MQLRTACFVITGVCLCAPALLSAQPPAGGPPGGRRAPYKPKNLQVLPDDTDLRKVMHGFTDSLGVECEFCHTKADPVTHREDRASDANPMKDTARYMIRMTDDLNSKYLAEVPNVKDKATVTCGTCHRGQKEPPAFVPPPRPAGRPGAPGPQGAPMSAPPAGATAAPGL